MKIIGREAVVALVLTGAVASTQVSTATSSSQIAVARTSALPTPMCPPDDPNACGIL